MGNTSILLTEEERNRIRRDLRQALHLLATLLLAEEKANRTDPLDPEPIAA